MMNNNFINGWEQEISIREVKKSSRKCWWNGTKKNKKNNSKEDCHDQGGSIVCGQCTI
jgi:hypothetical protein